MKRILILTAVVCFVALAADDATVVPQLSAGSQSTVVGRQSPVIGGAEAITLPQMLSYQGKLTDTLGQSVPNGNYSVVFKLYTVPTGGTPFWSETQNVTTKGGLFAVLLGAVTPIGSVPAAGALYLGMAVAGGAEMTPRVRIVSAAYAYKADTANFALASAGGGGTVTSVSQARGIVCTPNPITATGTVRLDTTYADARFIRNQLASYEPASWRISGRGMCSTSTGAALYGTATGNGYGVMGSGTSWPGVAGECTGDWGAVQGINNNSSNTGYTAGVTGHGLGGATGPYGVYGGSYNVGVYGIGKSGSSTGIVGVGNNNAGITVPLGSGGSFTGSAFGVTGHARDTSGCRGGYFDNGKGTYAHVAFYGGGVHYKISGSGLVSTTMKTRQGDKALFAPEMPEAYFEDCGEGQLANGHCRVNLEQLFSDCIAVDARHPLKVFVQLEDDCNGVYVNKDAAGFDVRELQGGKSNARFSWRVLAKWKGNENTRMPDAPGPEPTKTAKILTSVQVGTSNAAPQSEPVTK